MAETRGRIVVAGESLIDRIVRPDGGMEDVVGGGPFTTARALARLGLPVSFVGGLSTDPSGHRNRTVTGPRSPGSIWPRTIARRSPSALRL